MPTAIKKYPSTTAPDVLVRDFSKGRVTKYSVNTFLIPKNSVSNSINLNYDTVIGSAVVRLGTTMLGGAVASNKTPLGLTNYVGSGGTPNIILAVFSGASTASIYYYDTTWHTSGLTSLSNTSKVRFAQLGGSIFMSNGVDAMKSSTDGSTWVTTNCPTTVKPSLIFRAKSRLLAAGWNTGTTPNYRDRVWFSSVIAPQSSPFITWNEDTTSGDYIDINPDDSSNITAFAETSNQVLIFKGSNGLGTGMYRMDVINKSVDTQNIFNIGASSQEAVVTCQGIVYFFSGVDIRRTDGSYPEQISRLGVQDFIDAIPQANWSAVSAGTDGLNVYFDIGDVTLNVNDDNQQAYTNVRLKFSTRDETWSVHSYANRFKFFTNYTSTSGRTLIAADTTGSVQTMNSGFNDNSTPIFFFLETQEQEFGNRSHANGFNDLITIYAKDGGGTQVKVKSDEEDYDDVVDTLPLRVNTVDGVTFSGHYFTFKWFGSTSTSQPVFEGFQIEKAIDEGLDVTQNV